MPSALEASVPENSPKRLMFAHVARLAQAFASPVRVEIVDLLVQAPRSVDALAEVMGQSCANVSQHLQALRGAGLVVSRRQGKHVVYALSDDIILLVYQYLSEAADRLVAEALATRRTYYAERDPLPPVTVPELSSVLRDDRALLVDVRPAVEYRFDHIGSAVSMPVYDMAKRISDLPVDRLVVAYCRGPHCTYAYEAVGMLRKSGREARRLAGGYLGWKAYQLDKKLRRQSGRQLSGTHPSQR